jgi:hypothetical protein
MTSSIVDVTQAWIDLLKLERQLKLHDVFYGDQDLIPNVPALTVEAGTKTRDYNQTGLQTNVELSISFVLFHAKVADRQVTKKELDERAEALETFIHQNTNLDGLVINGLVTSSEPGFIERGSITFHAHRLIWEGLSKERIGA